MAMAIFDVADCRSAAWPGNGDAIHDRHGRASAGFAYKGDLSLDGTWASWGREADDCHYFYRAGPWGEVRFPISCPDTQPDCHRTVGREG